METTNGHGNGQETPPRRRRKSGNSADTSPIQQAELLHASLRDSLHKTRELIVALRRHKKQRRLVETTLASLKQLQGATK